MPLHRECRQSRAMLRGLFKLVFTLVTLLILAAGVFVLTVLQDEPTVTRDTTPTPENVQDARQFLRDMRASVQAGATGSEAPFSVTQAQLNSVLTLGARFVPGFRGQMEVADNRVTGIASVPMPYSNNGKWINLSAGAPAFEGAFALDQARVGNISLPPGLALEIGRLFLNTAFGNSIGDTALSAATGMTIKGDVVSFNLNIDDIGKNGVMRGVFGTLRGNDMPQTADIDRYYRQLRQAMDSGALPVQGSYLPYLHFTLAAALEGSRTEGIANAYTAALFALTRACGARDFTMVVGGLAGGEKAQEPTWQQDCSEMTLNGRIDSRRHFTTAAALQAASNRGFAVSVGEFKELYDSRHLTKGGFDFTDLAANNSGIRMSNRLMAASADAWPALLARMTTEHDVIVDFAGIPPLMPRVDFVAAYGDVDSPAYQAELERIETRIDALALHQ